MSKMNGENLLNKLVSYPVHNEAVLQKDYKIRARALGDSEWTELAAYRVKVDMHDVHLASMAYFDFEGSVEIEISGPWYIYQADIRPLSKKIEYSCDTKVLRFILDQPANLSIEFNRDRNHNLHLFAGPLQKKIPDKVEGSTLVIRGSQAGLSSFGAEVVKQLEEMPKGRTLYLEPGIHYIREVALNLPSDTEVYLAGGCILIGALICSHRSNIRIYGRGIIYQADFQRFSGINGVRLSHSEHISIEDVIIINPPHYTVYIGGSRDVTIRNVKSFSCEGWSDGLDVMSSRNILMEGCFLRTSDDCIAIYGSRWPYKGDTDNITVRNMTLWADVAHPINLGTHGDFEHEGNLIEKIHFTDIDILEHNEYQEGYLGCMAINVGDKNTARNITFENIRIEPFKHGKILDFQVKFNPDYNPAPGRRIENITLNNIQYHGMGEVPSMICGFNEEYVVDGVHLRNIIINDKKAATFEEANIKIGEFAGNITIE